MYPGLYEVDFGSHPTMLTLEFFSLVQGWALHSPLVLFFRERFLVFFPLFLNPLFISWPSSPLRIEELDMAAKQVAYSEAEVQKLSARFCCLLCFQDLSSILPLAKKEHFKSYTPSCSNIFGCYSEHP